jgi:hypothetical protein
MFGVLKVPFVHSHTHSLLFVRVLSFMSTSSIKFLFLQGSCLIIVHVCTHMKLLMPIMNQSQFQLNSMM